MRCNKSGQCRDCGSGVQLIEQRLGLLQIERVEAFGEPAIDWGEKIAGLIPLALIAPEPRHAHRRAQLPGLCLLLARDRERTLEIRFRFRRIRLAATSARFRRPCDGFRPRTIVSLVVSTAVIASPMQRQASSNWPSSAWALAKNDKNSGIKDVDPVDRHAVIPEVIIWIASEALPVRANTQPCFIIPNAFQNKVPFSSAKATSSSTSAFAAA